MQKIKNDNLNLGNGLRQMRKKYRFTQDQLVAQLLTQYGIDITRNFYSRLETGELNIPISVLVALRQLYNCSFDDFFNDLGIKDMHD